MTQKPENYALLTVEGKEIKLPLVIGSEGEKGIDISGLRRDTSCVTIDPVLRSKIQTICFLADVLFFYQPPES